MKIITTFILSWLLCQNGYSQIRFENGYFISNDGKRTDCLVKNIDWHNNPNEFTYKISKNAETKSATINDVAEFGIINVSRYKRFDVDIDRSSEIIEKLSETELPVFNNERLFLKVLVEGKATLYLYESKGITRYFMNTDSLLIEQLIFKNYLNAQGKIGENNTYRTQLFSHLTCSSIEYKNVENISYKQKELTDLFTRYNLCQHALNLSYSTKQKKGLFHVSVRPGINSANLVIQNSITNTIVSGFKKNPALRFGIEAELVMPFNKNKWAVIVEPVYQYFKSESINNNKKTTIDYKSIELQMGIRHFFFLNENSKIFLNGNVIYDLPFSSYLQLSDGVKLEIKSRLNSSLGVGYKFKDRFSAELKYMLNREILSDYVNWNSNYKTTTVILGYTIF